MIPYSHQCIDDDDIVEVVKVLKSDWLTTGPKVVEFEDALCNYVSCKYAVAVNSGTSALDIMVQALDLPQGSEVITTPFTFVATSNAILYNRLKPVFVDIERDTRNISPDMIREKVTDKTKAIVYVDYAGHPCDIDAIKEIAEEYDLFLIEDGCHALGGEYKGKRVGSLADMTVFSFHPVKAITTGEGGAVVTDSVEFYDKLRMLRNHGIDKPASDRDGWAYDMKFLGRNYRMSDIQAALGVSQLKKLDGFMKWKEDVVALYNEVFATADGIETPIVEPYAKHAWHIYTVLVNDRDALFKRMRKEGVGVNVHYIPIYRFSYYQDHLNITQNNFPIAEEVYSKVITLPLYYCMKTDEIKKVIESVKRGR